MKKFIKYAPLIAFLAFYSVIRICFLKNSCAIVDVEFKTLGIVHSSFPLGILTNTLYYDCFSPLYYYLIFLFDFFFKNVVVLKVFNALLSLGTIYIVHKTVRLYYGRIPAILSSILLAINHFFLFYTNLIAPYCLVFFIGAWVLNALFAFLNRPTKSNFKKLLIANIFLMLSGKTVLFYIFSEIFVLNKIKFKKPKTKKLITALNTLTFLAFICILPLILVQEISQNSILIADLSKKIALNFNSLYLLLNEYITPFLSFETLENQKNTTLGLVYSFFLNPNIFNLNSLKILLVLFYSSILPIIFGIYFFKKASQNDFKLSIVSKIALLNLAIVLVFGFFHILDVQPIYTIQFFMTFIILLSIGLASIKDYLIRYILIFCIVAIQLINPKINSFNTSIHKKYPVCDIFKVFSTEYKSAANSLYLIPYMGQYAKPYFKKNFQVLEFDYSKLFVKSKDNNFWADEKNLSRKNFNRTLKTYLADSTFSDSIERYFSESDVKLYQNSKNVILFIDKLNSRPVSTDAIQACIKETTKKGQLTKISFLHPNKDKKSNKELMDSTKSKALYSLSELLKQRYYIYTVIQYKKVGDRYIKVQNKTNNIYKELISYRSDYVFIVFGKMLY